MSHEPSQQSSELGALEPAPVTKQLKPGKWYGFIALLCGLQPVLFLCYVFFVMPFTPCCTSPWTEIAVTLGFGSLACPFAGIIFGILGHKTEGQTYGYIGFTLSLLYGLFVLGFVYVNVL